MWSSIIVFILHLITFLTFIFSLFIQLFFPALIPSPLFSSLFFFSVQLCHVLSCLLRSYLSYTTLCKTITILPDIEFQSYLIIMLQMSATSMRLFWPERSHDRCRTRPHSHSGRINHCRCGRSKSTTRPNFYF